MAEGKDNDKLTLEEEEEVTSNEEKREPMDKLRELFNNALGFSSKETSKPRLDELSLRGVAKYMLGGKCKNVIIMCGAGISTSAGIPDFRSPSSGLYANLQRFNLPDPQCIFEINFFKENPEPFFALAKDIFPKELYPTPCHHFLSLLHEKGSLLRVYTQNIDTLERIANVPRDKLVEAHGTFHTSHCLGLKCRREYSLEWMKEKIFADEIPRCTECAEVVKPDVVFFGENLPSRFFELVNEDFPKCDLLIVMGTSLLVQPFASLVARVPNDAPRLLINKEKTGQADPVSRILGMGSGLEFESKSNVRDVAWIGLCDDGCQQLADLLGWGEELRARRKANQRSSADHRKKEWI